MHLLKILEARERGILSSHPSGDVLVDRTTNMAISQLSSHSRHDTYPCTGFKSNEDYMVYDVPPFVSRFSMEIGYEHILAVASEEGEITIFDTTKRRSEASMTKFRAHENAIFDICWAHDEPSFITASGDSTALLWDVSTYKKVAEFVGHRGSVKTVAFQPKNKSVFATGSRDGDIIVWDTRVMQSGRGCHADNILRSVHQMSVTGNTSKQKKQTKTSTVESVTAVVFQDDNHLISVGVGDGLIKMWDLRKSYCAYKNDPLPKYAIPYPGKSVKKIGYSSLILDSSCSCLYASCTDNTIYEFNCTGYDIKPVMAYHGHLNSTYFVKARLSPCDRFLLSGSSDCNAYIWKVGMSDKPVYRLSGHSEEVTCVDWCQSNVPKIVTCSDDKTYRIWQIPPKLEKVVHITHGTVEKLGVQADHCSPVLSNVPCGALRTPAKISPVKRRCFTSPLQNIENITSIDSPKSPYTSPTQNLPNLVMDRLRTPDGDKMCTKQKITNFKKVDWLTEFTTKFQQQSSVQRKRPLTVRKPDSVSKRRKVKQSLENNRTANKCLENYYK